MVHIPRGYRRLFQDAISITIPLEVTADMGIAMSKSRTKRILKLRERFPSLATKPEKQATTTTSSSDEENDKNNDEEKDSSNDDKENKKTTPTKKRHGMPQRHEYASVVDYLEAKYIQGVMVHDEDGDGPSVSSNERGSVYSEDSSFLDDTELKRDVVGQVLSQSIHTKLETTSSNDDDNDFFVNVGNLEVEDSQHLMDYDISKDETLKKKKKPTTTKKPATKKKRSSSADSKPSLASPKKKAKTKKSDPGGSSPSKKKKTSQKDTDPNKAQEIAKLKQKAQECRTEMESLYDKVVAAIRNMTEKELPRKKKNIQVSLVVPPGTKGGDSIVFSSQHVPGKQLKTTVPKNAAPGTKFKVSVPAPKPPDNADNKFDRSFQDLLDDYSRAHDSWGQAEARYRQENDEEDSFQLHQERMNKFDTMLEEFPSNLLVPVDGSYMRKIVRRARQNKHKRKKTVAKQEEEPAADAGPKTMTMNVPSKGNVFAKVEFNPDDFVVEDEEE